MTTNTYDQRGFLSTVKDVKNGISAFYYDKAGRKIAEVSPNNYDVAKTLSQMNRSEFTYDLMSRLKTKSETYIDPKTSQWKTVIVKAFNYDSKGNKIKEMDALGYSSGYGIEYTYNLAGKPLTAIDAATKAKGSALYCKI